ncbi:MAG: tetratricopeptide repeat protein [Tepidisphaeraceae bacterium]|jgi:predicted O-linked N-acetylglucosamine transferase (SPINDLY family)/glycosyltransferase involved in cell wall biosynthesis
MMRIALLDFLKRDYTVLTARQSPLGGSPSAVSYLSEQFAALGHSTFLINYGSAQGNINGVEHLSWNQFKIEQLGGLNLDAAIVIQAAGRGQWVKTALGENARLILWNQDGVDQPTVWPLHEPAERDSYDGMAMVSRWQAEQFIREFSLDPARIALMGNAIAPAFAGLLAKEDSILAKKAQPPWLVYASTPYRGLELLLDLFPDIRAKVPDARLGVFSSMNVYQMTGHEAEKYRPLYDRCRQTPGVEYFGSVAQPALAQWLLQAAVMAYPNTYCETACIAVMEGMAAGCQIVTSDLAALPETTAGFARLVPPDFQNPANRRRFVEEIVAVLRQTQSDPAGVEQTLRRQVDFVNAKYTWPVRALEWLAWLPRLSPRKPAVTPEAIAQRQEMMRLATEKFEARRLPDAEAACRNLLRDFPDHVEANHLIGLIAFQSGRSEEALQILLRTVKMNPHRPDFRLNLGLVLVNLGRGEEALEAFEFATRLRPDFPEAHQNLAQALLSQQKTEEGIAALRRYLELRPGDADAWNSLGTHYQRSDKLDEAKSAYQSALAAKSDYPLALYNLGLLLREQNRWSEAVDVLRRAVAARDEFPDAHNNLASALKHIGEFREAEKEYRRTIALRPSFAEAHSNLIMLLHYAPGKTPADILAEMRRWNERHVEPRRHLIRPCTNDRNPGRRLRIGYVSPDFSSHVVGMNLWPLFANHDRESFEVYCYSNTPHPDALTDHFRGAATEFREIQTLSDERAAEMIRTDRIDILVDLAGHTANHRLLVFARKPAPIQLTFGGYPGGTGLETMDYRLTDPYLDPPGKTENHYTEKLHRLPHSFWCYDPRAMAPAADLNVGPLPASMNGYVTFGCLNNFMKVTPPVLRIWAEVLAKIPQSRLLILVPEGKPRQDVLQILPADRIEFVNQQSRREYLETFHRIDIGLDTLPYNGHTTSLDAMWMGVPVLTMLGETAVGRAGWSHLSNTSLTDLASQRPEDLPALAQKLAGDLPRLMELRATMRDRLNRSALTDGRRFARNIESAYRQIWKNWCERSE